MRGRWPVLTVDIEASGGAVALVTCRARAAHARSRRVGAGDGGVTAAVIGQALIQTPLKQRSNTQCPDNKTRTIYLIDVVATVFS